MTEAGARQGEHRYTNHLIDESSPYLLMHAHNPVDWHAWGEAAFDLAQRENRPIFLSVGYSTCHWCHVMERESFSDPRIAEIMNAHFVNIKADREERPDVDHLYMVFVQATTGGGGWPMSVFLTPGLKPFFGGTYWPPEDRYGRPGFGTVLSRVAEAWQKDQSKIEQSAAEVAEYLKKSVNAPAAASAQVGASTLDQAYRQIEAGYDAAHGGFGNAPKFPRPVVCNFLLRYYARTHAEDALAMTLRTLDAMARGGLHDHLGGGFHRYSVDARWHVPHFEKMLYDQAQLAVAYLEAYQITREAFYADTARDIIGYVRRDLRSPEGGFYSAEDADSLIEKGKPEHGEGAFYTWTAEEIEQVLGPEAAATFSYAYDAKPSGNVESDPQDEFRGKNILQAVHSIEEAAEHFSKPAREIRSALAEAREKLLEARNRRPRPALDDKILTSWNGLMISGFARAAQVLDDSSCLETARTAADFIRSKLYDGQNKNLMRRYRSGSVAIHGFLDDYAFLIQGLLDLYEASFEVPYLAWAAELQERQDQLFWDGENGGYFSTPAADASLFLRMRDAYDGAEPAANSVAAMNLLRLAQMTDRDRWRDYAQELFAAFGRQIENSPETVPQMLAALDFSLKPARQVVVAGDPAAEDTRALLRVVHERFLPNKILFLIAGPGERDALGQWLPFVRDMQPLGGKATAYVCENYTCKLPTSDPQEAAQLMAGERQP